jgi:hypothetical protein
MKLSKVLSFALMATGTGITIGAYKRHNDIESQKIEGAGSISSEEMYDLDNQDEETQKLGRLGLSIAGAGAALAVQSFLKDAAEAKKLKDEEEFYAKLDQRYVTRDEFEALSKHTDEIRECHNNFVRHQWDINKQLKGEVMDLVDSMED